MYQPQRIRTGFVTIHRRPNGKYIFSGLNVMGRDREGQLCNRLLWLHHAAPEWFRELCNQYADTSFKVNMRVEKLHNTGVALLMPVASSQEEALKEYTERYSTPPTPIAAVTPAETQSRGKEELPPSAFDNAFKAHEFAASIYKLEVIEHVRDGLKSFTRVREKNGVKHRLVGGMLINKVAKTYNPDDPKWRTALTAFVRRHPEQ